MAKMSALRDLDEITATPHPTARPRDRADAPPRAAEPMTRYTAEIPRALHRRLKTFAMDNDVSTYAVTRALLGLLEDEAIAARVRALVAQP